MPAKFRELQHTVCFIRELDAETGDFSRFDSLDKILAYAGLSPSTYQSGKLDNAYALPLPSLCALQRHKVRLSLGCFLLRVSGKKEG